MIHNKYFEILKQFIGNYNREVYGRQLINTVNISQKNIALTLNELENKAILKSIKRGNMKFHSLNLKNPQIKDYIIIIEFLRKIGFLLKYKKLAHIFNKDDRIIGIFGSYAKEKQKKESDIDVFVIGNKKKEDYYEAGKLYDLDISIKYFTKEEFKILLKEKNKLMNEIIENHILIFNIEKFIGLIWSDYYGFD
ncbi:MAG: nucleotidyltransferase domain-containing protein [Nanoarchaeota archaeon]|nr:nucleotidyltransferase domain-containing protein [Nanoarchaeota archaeon]